MPDFKRREAWLVEVNHEQRTIRAIRSNPSVDGFHIAMTHARVASTLLASGGKPTFAAYVRAMNEAKVDVLVPALKDGKLPGLAFSNGASTLLASDIARDGKVFPLTWNGLKAAGFDCDIDRDQVLLENLHARPCNPVRPSVLPTAPAAADAPRKETLDVLHVSGISGAEQERNARLIGGAIKNGYDSLRQFVVSGDPKLSGGRHFDFCVLRGLRKVVDNGKQTGLSEYDPLAGTKIFTRRPDGLFTKTSTSKPSQFEVTRVRHYGSLAEAKRLATAMGGYTIMGDAVDPTQAVVWSSRRSKSGPDQSTSKFALSDAGLAAVAVARGFEPRNTRDALREPGITLDEAVTAARTVGFDVPADVRGWAYGELERRPALHRDDNWPDAGKWAALGTERQARYLAQDSTIPDTVAWLAATRLADLEERGFKVQAAETVTATFVSVPVNRIEFDLDGMRVPTAEQLHKIPEWQERYPQGFDLEQRPDEFVQWWAETYLPPEFHGVGAAWANSSSAGFQKVGTDGAEDLYKFVGLNAKGKADIHLALPLEGLHDPALVGEACYAHAKHRLAALIEAGVVDVKPGDSAKSLTGIDRAFWRTVQPQYGMPPVVQDERANRLPDPLASVRDGELPGRPGAVLPDIDATAVRRDHADIDGILANLGVAPDDNGGLKAAPSPFSPTAPRVGWAAVDVTGDSDAAMKAAMLNAGRDRGGHMHQEVFLGVTAYVREITFAGREISEDDITDATASMLTELDEVRQRGGMSSEDEAKFTPAYVESQARTAAFYWNGEWAKKQADIEARQARMSRPEAILGGSKWRPGKLPEKA